MSSTPILVVLIFIYMEASSNGLLVRAIIDGNTANLFVYSIKNLIASGYLFVEGTSCNSNLVKLSAVTL